MEPIVKRSVFLIGMALLATACSGSGSTETTDTSPETTVGEAAADLLLPTTTTTTTVTVFEDCDGLSTEISLDSSVNSEVVGVDQGFQEPQYFCVRIPDGIIDLSVEISGMTADLNLYVGHPDLDTVRNGGLAFWASDDRGTGVKSVVITQRSEYRTPGLYYIEVSAEDSSDSSGFTLIVNSQ